MPPNPSSRVSHLSCLPLFCLPARLPLSARLLSALAPVHRTVIYICYNPPNVNISATPLMFNWSLPLIQFNIRASCLPKMCILSKHGLGQNLHSAVKLSSPHRPTPHFHVTYDHNWQKILQELTKTLQDKQVLEH